MDRIRTLEKKRQNLPIWATETTEWTHMNKASETCEMLMKEPTFVSESQKEKSNWPERVLKEIIAKNSLNLERHTNVHIQEATQTPNTINPRKSMARHIINLCKLKTQKNLESSQRKTMHYLYQFKWQWFRIYNYGGQQEVPFFQAPKEPNCQPQILYPEKLSFRHEGGKKKLSNKEEFLKEFITSRHTLKEWLKEVLQYKGSDKRSFWAIGRNKEQKKALEG